MRFCPRAGGVDETFQAGLLRIEFFQERFVWGQVHEEAYVLLTSVPEGGKQIGSARLTAK